MFGIGKKGKAYRFEYSSKNKLADQHELLDRYIKDVSNCRETGYYQDIPLKKTETGTEISKMPAEAICNVVMAAHERLEHSEKPYRKQQRENRGNMGQNDIYLPRHILFFLVRVLTRRKLPFSPRADRCADDVVRFGARCSEFFDLHVPSLRHR